MWSNNSFAQSCHGDVYQKVALRCSLARPFVRASMYTSSEADFIWQEKTKVCVCEKDIH